MPPPIPDRWTEYKPLGRIIEGTNIVCFKVPLRENVQVGKSEIKKIWTIKTLLEALPDLKAVIDLTNTARYYDSRDLVCQGVLHTKILMPGRILPPEDKVELFMNMIDEYSNQNMLVGVHCTHGLNRTGYMVCRYMRDRLGMTGSEAIKKFEKARGYPMEREVYTNDLLNKSKPQSSSLRTNGNTSQVNRDRSKRPHDSKTKKVCLCGKMSKVIKGVNEVKRKLR